MHERIDGLRFITHGTQIEKGQFAALVGASGRASQLIDSVDGLSLVADD